MATLLQIINADQNLALFSKGLASSGLANKLADIGPFTIVGPVNLALGRLSPYSFDQLMELSNSNRLISLLSDYVLVGKKMFSDFRDKQSMATISGKNVDIRISNGDILVNGSKILARDRQGANGVLHLIDKAYFIE